eukprot:CAMPEP_0201693950 /NCGR_PEP_ID=MMETSP0578-20130828/6376_1 /ASSEMBLY_ACC=CAM_ASM_000663 /TAXON_ID=267565 /ORGANISM="Skeletonema grethea, Strain CCMP 1804" /LENGTH=518 /DNA_ID=CAMNT_0048179559 /DNA_START=202 /DNA_END=1758 /DNA_ORIENTATION=-
MQQAPTPITKRRRRRRCQSSTTTITLALLLTVAIEMLPSSQNNYYFMARASSPASLHKNKKTRRLGSTATTAKTNGSSSSNSSNNNNSLERVVIVQPNNLGQAMSDEDKAKFLYEVAKFSSTLEGGTDTTKKEAVSSEAMQASYNSGGNGGDEEADTSIATYQEWVAMKMAEKKMGSTGSGRINMNAHAYYMPQQQLGSTAEGAVDSSSSVTAAGGEEEAPAMQQIIPEKQVILRPMSQLDDPSSSTKKTLSVPALGSTQNGGQDQEPEVYYYDAGGLVGTAYRNTPELTLPDEVYTASGQKLKLSDVHDGGKAEVFLEMNPKTVLGKSLTELNSIPKSMSSSSGGGATSSLFVSRTAASTTAGNAAQQSQDQMIVFLTVATMAIMVGMLSARRLRSRKFLEQCMTPDLEDDLDDVVRYDKKFDERSAVGSSNNSHRYTADAGAASYAYAASGGSTLGDSPGRRSDYAGSETSLPHFSDLYPTQSSSIMGSLSRRSGYGTNDSVGGMNWRGDMEKFDV